MRVPELSCGSWAAHVPCFSHSWVHRLLGWFLPYNCTVKHRDLFILATFSTWTTSAGILDLIIKD